MKPENVALRDNLLAALRTEDLPISTNDLAALMPWQIHVDPCRQHLHYSGDSDRIRLVTCDGTTHVREVARCGFEVYRHLRALEQKGLIERIKLDGHYSAYWRAVVDEAQRTAEIADLEAMWSA